MYGSDRKFYLQMLDPIYKQDLRHCLRSFRIFPVERLYFDARELSLGVRRWGFLCSMLPRSNYS